MKHIDYLADCQKCGCTQVYAHPIHKMCICGHKPEEHKVTLKNIIDTLYYFITHRYYKLKRKYNESKKR